jgi:hypothetical protein
VKNSKWIFHNAIRFLSHKHKSQEEASKEEEDVDSCEACFHQEQKWSFEYFANIHGIGDISDAVEVIMAKDNPHHRQCSHSI